VRLDCSESILTQEKGAKLSENVNQDEREEILISKKAKLIIDL
jgi:hypothetical protein